MWVVSVPMESVLPNGVGFTYACSSNWYGTCRVFLMYPERDIHWDAAFLPTGVGDSYASMGSSNRCMWYLCP